MAESLEVVQATERAVAGGAVPPLVPPRRGSWEETRRSPQPLHSIAAAAQFPQQYPPAEEEIQVKPTASAGQTRHPTCRPRPLRSDCVTTTCYRHPSSPIGTKRSDSSPRTTGSRSASSFPTLPTMWTNPDLLRLRPHLRSRLLHPPTGRVWHRRRHPNPYTDCRGRMSFRSTTPHRGGADAGSRSGRWRHFGGGIVGRTR